MNSAAADLISNSVSIDVALIKKGVASLRVLNNKRHQDLLELMHKKERVKVKELYKTLQLQQSITSMRLKLLRKTGVVTTHKEGREIYYCLNYPWLEETHRSLAQLIYPKPTQKLAARGPLQPSLYKKGALVLRALNHSLRQAMLQALSGKERLCVGEWTHEMALPYAIINQQIRLLREGGYISREREGKVVYYRVNEQRLVEVHHIIRELIKQ